MSWNPYIIQSFEFVFRPWMRSRIAEIHLRGDLGKLSTEHPVIVIANHSSWWDAFLVRELHRGCKAPCPLFTLMDEDELARYPLFRRMGVLGMSARPNALRSVIRELEAQAGPFWLTIFAQGSIWPSWRRPLGFQRGLEFFSRALAPCTVVPVSLHLEAMTHAAPTAFVGIGEPIGIEAGGSASAAAVEQRVENLLDTLISILADHGEDAAAVWQQDVPNHA